MRGSARLPSRVRHTGYGESQEAADSLQGALANEKTPLRDTAPPTPQRAQQTADRSTVARRRVIVGVVAAVVLIGGLFLLLGGGGGDSPIAAIIGDTTPPPETFVFKNVASGYQATVAKVDKKKQMKTAKAITPDVQAVITELLQTGYVDPDTWGDAGAIEDLFTGPAVDQVEPHVDTLTLGTDAADTYESLNPNASRLKVVALTDGDANATRAMADFDFSAKATLDDGTLAKVTVTGILFFVPDGDTWKIEAFDVRREIEPKKPKASASASTSPSESA